MRLIDRSNVSKPTLAPRGSHEEGGADKLGRIIGFTLIELLIVVAIIGILAAIAIPNFLQAQVRAKVARAVSDIRTVSVALETYRIDNNVYAFDLDSRGWPWYLTDAMSTPINHLTNASSMRDPFREDSVVNPPVGERYRYVNLQANEGPSCWPPCPFPGPYLTNWVGCISSDRAAMFRERFGDWRLLSTGPDKTASYLSADFFGLLVLYDPTNGTVSYGDIVRSQKYAQQEE